MQKAITTIIGEIPSGFVFDSHFVINELIKGFSDEYLIFASQFCNPNNKNVTLTVHGQIGQIISQEPNIDYVGKARSENIHKKTSDCTCWKKK